MLNVIAASTPSGYRIANSLRFRSSASAYLSRTPASAGNRTTWTWSAWVKRGAIGSEQMLFNVRNGISDTTTLYWEFSANDTFQLSTNSTPNPQLVTTQVFRDPSAWYHFVLSVDTTQATASNRIKLYVNGAQVTAFSTATYPTQNALLAVNQSFAHQINCFYNGSTYSLFNDSYLAEVNFIDGQALTPSSFGETSSTTGVWIPKRYSGTYGTNGFYLNFSNGTSTTTLGYDSSGNSNNWTTNNISLTTGSTYDWMIDSPTSFAGSSYGVGNYAVLNPLWKLLTSNNNTLSNGNLNVTIVGVSGGSFDASISTMPLQGLKYFELTVPSAISTSGSYALWAGISTSGVYQTDSLLVMSTYSGSGTPNGLNTTVSGSTTSISAFTPTLNDVYGFAIDASTGKTWFRRNSSTWLSGDPVAGTSPSKTFSATNLSNLYVTVFGRENSNQIAVNFGQRPFSYTPPTGYKSLCTYNLPTPSIVNGARYMAATTYTGTGATQSIVNAGGFQPDLVWIKDRTAANSHYLQDVIRGSTNRLASDSTAAEATVATGVTSFNSNGFSLGSWAGVNTSGDNLIAWQWKANGTAVTNNAGSISSQVSANTTAGFSVVTYTGTGANATVGHGLGIAPSMMIVKSRSRSTDDWVVYHISVGATAFLRLNTTGASQIGSTIWNNTTPSSTVITLGTANAVNDAGGNVAYCFAAIPGYSAFGNYTGNGSTDGPFVYCGFRPRFVLIKCSSTTDQWIIHDTARDPYNISNYILFPNLSDGGYTYDGTNTSYPFDMLSNGFKIRSTYPNSSGATYIYAAFAENPFKNSLAR